MRLTVSETAALLNTPEERVFEWIENDNLPAQRVRGEYRINRTELLEWSTSRPVTVAPSAFIESVATGIDSLADALRAGGVHYDVSAVDGTDTIRQIVDSFELAGDADRESLLQFLLARDSFGLTLAAEGIAIPQVRTPAVLPARGEPSSLLSLSFLSRPLMLSTAAGPRVVEAIFFLISPTVTAHLAMLSKLTAALSNEAFHAAIKRRRYPDEIQQAASEAEKQL